MQQEKDYIQREIQKLALILSQLIGKIVGVSINDFEAEFEQIEQNLKTGFGITIKEISEMKNSELLHKLKNMHVSHIEKLVELIVIVLDKLPLEQKNKLIEKATIMLEYLDKTSKTFSMQRAELKTSLQQL